MKLRSLIEYYLLSEAPFDVWIRKNPNQNVEQAKIYFDNLTTKYSPALHPSAKDLTSLSFEQLQTLNQSIEQAREKNLKALQVQWLTKQIKEKQLSFNQVKEDYIPVLQAFQKHGIKPDLLNQINSIEELNKKINEIVPASDETSVVSEEQYGKVIEKNGWAVYMPHTTEASCELGKTAGKRDTTWCTTRTDGNNPFLSYVARGNSDIVLFYVIKKGVNAEKNPFAKMSVGFINGESKFDQGSGNVSVNADNQNLTEEKFKEVLGVDLASEFLGLMKKKSEEIKGKHPAKQELELLLQDPKAFQKKLDSFADNETGQQFKQDFIISSLKYPNISPEILKTLAGNKDKDVRLMVANNRKTPPETLNVLAVDKNSYVRLSVIANPNSLPETLQILVGDKDSFIRMTVARNPKTLPETLQTLAGDKDKDVRFSVAENPNTLPETLQILAGDKDPYILRVVARNPNTPPEILQALAGDKLKDVRVAAKKRLKAMNLLETLIIEKVLSKLIRKI